MATGPVRTELDTNRLGRPFNALKNILQAETFARFPASAVMPFLPVTSLPAAYEEKALVSKAVSFSFPVSRLQMENRKRGKWDPLETKQLLADNRALAL